MPSHIRRKKADLSYVNPVEWEENARALEQPATLSFRTSTPLRKLLFDYLRHVEPVLHDPSINVDSPEVEDKLADALRSTFGGNSLDVLGQIGFDATDVASWSWIFSSQSVDLAVARYTALAEDLRRSKAGRIPKFVPLQLLRAGNLSAFALKELINSMLTDLRICQDTKRYFGWSWTTRVCLVVRLLRHARRVDPNCLDDITRIVKHLFSDYYMVHPRSLESPELKRLSHIFNRFLTLIALAPFTTPFNAYLLQQNAQLSLVRLMVGFQPQLPLNREGYRALISVQLLHRKSRHERTWAEAKSPSWPPWRRIKSGIEQDLQYPGKESRAMRLLRRMNEAGYTHGVWEKSAAVLAGWDTDKSPTIQTRAILMRQRQPWLKPQPGRDLLDRRSDDEPELWAARIRATRSRREAWAAFCAYEKSATHSKTRYLPYFAMLDKLLAQTADASSPLGSAHVPGDVKEVFEDPTNPRDLLYLEKEIPSADEFYENMLREGIKPAGSILSGLLNHALDIEAGFSYVQDSRWDEVTKDVLCHAEKYPPAIIRDTLNRIPGHSLAAFIWLLCKYGYDSQPPLYELGVDVANDQLSRERQVIAPLSYAWQLLYAGDAHDIRAWNAFLRGASRCLSDARVRCREGKLAAADYLALSLGVWRRLWRTFSETATDLDIHPDLNSFRYLARTLIVLVREVRLQVSTERFGSLAKFTFLRAVYGRATKTFLPSASTPFVAVPEAADLRLMVRILVSVHDVDGLLALLRWMNEHAGVFGSLSHHSEHDGEVRVEIDLAQDQDRTPAGIRTVLCALRLFLEGNVADEPNDQETLWFETPLAVTPRTVEEARALCEPLGWPSDEETRLFLLQEADWMARVARAADAMALKHSQG
ncbi:uncharacterized protein Z518_01832 [Rhinocladiella mackenziei CBS 650.93]|uniref:Uncharacterized protein n=1 Tax=Rhinocladiella mackenziei CBS 650.93 TaxID=1442369 RepID=A0A0D2IMZ6_9EURO|nr:uncharacterized protein Z518_01832 [Rhinocladiella mackenziei CBS 650.93]KIX07179.1 hypothetical protein Z518_01832 [Rhinocladiella mackenziei CBS 650.93]